MKTSPGKQQICISITDRAYSLIKQLAPNGRGYGRYVSTLIEGSEGARNLRDMEYRIRQLEETLEGK